MVVVILISAGVGDVEKIVATNAAGRLDDTLLNVVESGNSVVLKMKSDKYRDWETDRKSVV